jgi:hypothetical protein
MWPVQACEEDLVQAVELERARSADLTYHATREHRFRLFRAAAPFELDRGFPGRLAMTAIFFRSQQGKAAELHS